MAGGIDIISPAERLDLGVGVQKRKVGLVLAEAECWRRKSS